MSARFSYWRDLDRYRSPRYRTNTARRSANQQRRDDDRGLWGLAGLLGLAGLAGLMRRRDKYDTRGNTTTTTTRLP